MIEDGYYWIKWESGIVDLIQIRMRPDNHRMFCMMGIPDARLDDIMNNPSQQFTVIERIVPPPAES